MKKGRRTENLPMKITVSRMRGNEEWIEIRIQDSLSSLEFVTVKMSCEDFAKALTGMGSCPGIGVVSGLDRVGKVHENDTITFILPQNTDFKNKKEIASQMALEACPKGWEPDLYFASQNSFFMKDGREWARCTIRRWRTPDDSD